LGKNRAKIGKKIGIISKSLDLFSGLLTTVQLPEPTSDVRPITGHHAFQVRFHFSRYAVQASEIAAAQINVRATVNVHATGARSFSSSNQSWTYPNQASMKEVIR
jgi:hypothetical protein